MLQSQESKFKRNEDARRKIALGGLIVKAGLDDETTAVILGLLDEAKEKLLEKDGSSLRTYWRMRGARIFENDQKNKS